MVNGIFKCALICALLLGAVAWAQPAEPDQRAVLEEIVGNRSNAIEGYESVVGVLAESVKERRNAEAVIQKDALEEIQQRSSMFLEDSLPEGALQSRLPYADEFRSHLVFASTAMPEADLRALMEVAADRAEVHIVFRGVPRAGGVDGFMKTLQRLAKGMERQPPMTIDPPLWRQFKVEVVPTIVTLVEGIEIGRATGTANPQWMDEQLAKRKGDLGRYGEVVFPTEPDMEDVLREAVASIDEEAFKRDAEQAFWRSQGAVELPPVTEARQRRVDPSVEITRDVVLPDGRVLAKKGDRINPLLAMQFDQRLIVINGADATQRALARRLADEAGLRRVVVMSTGVPDFEDGAATWGQWQQEVDQPMYLLNDQIRNALQVTHVPTMIEADGDHLVLDEYLVDERGR